MLIGYARVSTNDQDTALQLDALREAGVRKVYSEKTSSVGKRPQLAALLERIKAGDVLVVWKLDRLARSLGDLLGILEALRERGAGLRSLTEPIDTSSAMGVFVLQVLGAVAQLERSMIRERSIAGQVAAYRRGVRWGGRRPSLGQKETALARRLHDRGHTMQSIAEQLGVSRSTVSRALSPPKPRVRVAMPVLRGYLQAIA